MATAPQFAATPNPGVPGSLTAANTSKDGTGSTGRLLIFTGAANGSVLPFARNHPKGGNVATLIRYFKNNGSDPEVAANNSLIAEHAIALSTLSETAANAVYDTPLNVVLASGERVYALLATAVATGVAISPMNGGDF
jgi:hypothetical protein